MVTREQITAEKVNALIRMIEEGGESNSGELPPKEYIRAIRQIEESNDGNRIADKHRNREDVNEWVEERRRKRRERQRDRRDNQRERDRRDNQRG